MNAFMLGFIGLLSLIVVISAHGIGNQEPIRFHPEEFVNPLAGTFSSDDYSTGNTLPLLGLPWGFNHWSVQTVEDRGSRSSSWWFSGNHREFQWIRCTHQPSPWIGDWGWFLFAPMVGNPSRNPSFSYEPRGSTFKPYYLNAVVAPFNIEIELTPTSHGAVLRVTFPSRGEKFICFAEADWGESSSSPYPHFYGSTYKVHSDRKQVVNFKLHLYAESSDAKSIEHHEDMICFTFHSAAKRVEVKMATSLISGQQAKVSLDYEVAKGESFDNVMAKSKDIWNKMLSRVEVKLTYPITEEHSRHLTVFYTSLYRALLFPRRLDERTAAGDVVHYSPYDNSGRTYPGPLCTDNGFWDTFRTVYPLLSFLYPDYLGDIIQGWLNAYKEGEWLPSWASPGYRNCMVGTYADVSIADAISKNIGGFDINLAVEALQKDAYSVPPNYAGGAMGKEGLNDYKSLGFVPNDVSRSLDFGFADYATAQAFRSLCSAGSKLNEASDSNSILIPQQCDEILSNSKDLLSRSIKPVEKLFDRRNGLMVPKSASGEFSSSFNDVTWGNGYTEGSAWHHSFPPYAMSTLLRLHADRSGGSLLGQQDSTGKTALASKLLELFTHTGDYRYGSYGQEIHEMREMKTLAMGQYGHNNQPSHHIPFLFALIGKPQLTYSLVRKILDRAYGIDFYSGDEDNGEQGAWFVMAALGVFPVAPGAEEYVLSSPIFPYVKIYRGPKDSSDTAKYKRYDLASGRIKEALYQPYRRPKVFNQNYPFVDSSLDQNPTTIHSTRTVAVDDSSSDRHLHIFAQGVSKETINIAAVVVGKLDEMNKCQRVVSSTISDAILHTTNHDVYLRFITENEVLGTDSLAGVDDLNTISNLSPISWQSIISKIPLLDIATFEPNNQISAVNSHSIDSTQVPTKDSLGNLRPGKKIIHGGLGSEGGGFGFGVSAAEELLKKNKYIEFLENKLSIAINTTHSRKDSQVHKGDGFDDRMILTSEEQEVTWDIYVLLVLLIVMSGYLGAQLLHVLGITGHSQSGGRGTGALQGFERSSIKARTV